LEAVEALVTDIPCLSLLNSDISSGADFQYIH
jgi:hypothetical protein